MNKYADTRVARNRVDRNVVDSLAPCLLLAVLLAFAGCDSDSGDDAPMPPPPDTTAPTVSDVDAGGGAAVSRTVTLTVTASDNTAVTTVRFFVDGTEAGSDTTAPYEFAWDTGSLADGDYVLSAEAEDAAGNVGQSGEVTVTVSNARQFSVTLGGNEEVPPRDAAGSGSAELDVNLATGVVSGELEVNGITPTDAHIHDAFAGVNGPVAIGLEQDAGNPRLFTVPADAVLDEAMVDKLLAGGLYLNVHTSAAPAGAIRGQILPDGFELYFAGLDADETVPPIESTAAGRAAVTFDTATGALVVQVQVAGLDNATDAHVHDGYAGANGAVLVGLTQDTAEPGHWFVTDGTLNAAGAEALAEGRLYVNVHSPDHPGGEIRGQILPDGIVVFRADLSGEQEVPLVETPASGVAFVTYDQAAALASIHATTDGLDDASDAHLHSAVGGVNGGVAIGLTQDGSDPAHWFAEEAAVSAELAAALLAAGTYVNVHSPDHPGGEIRGQVVPDDIVFASGRLEGRQEVPAIDSSASGSFAVTADPETMLVTAHATTIGLDDATAAHLHDAYAGVSGGVAIGLAQDAGDPAHWSVTDAAATAAQLDALRAGRLYVNVHTPANPGGEIRGQAAPRGIEVLFNALAGDAVVPPADTPAGGLVATTTDLATREFVAVVNTTDADDATSAGIHAGPAGANGDEILPLGQAPTLDSQWSAMAVLDEAAFAAYLADGLYAEVSTPAHPDGALRAQILRSGAPAPAPDTDAPVVTLASPGDTVGDTVTLEADATDDTGVTEVRFFADDALIDSDASAPYSVDWDTTGTADGEVVLTAEAEDAAGNIGTSAEVVVTVDNAEEVSFAALQGDIFGPFCSGCHTGPSGSALPGGMDLSSTADSYASLVGVSSIQQPTLDRVEPGNPDDSYLVRKLEGGPDITGTRMPQGGPFLNQAAMDRIRQWITDGAPNN